MTESNPTSAPPVVDPAVDVNHPSVNLLIMATGSIAAIKLGLLLDQFATEHCHIRIAATSSAFHFLHRAQPSNTGIPFQSILTDKEEWEAWQTMNDTVVHIELRRWADLVVIAPLDANSLAKISTGLCDNLVTCVMRAWEVQEKPVIICPAMNSAMWTHTITAKQIASLREWYMTEEAAKKAMSQIPPVMDGEEAEEPPLPETLEEAMFQIVGPVSKRLACGDVGMGGMASVESIAAAARHTMNLIREKKKQAFLNAQHKENGTEKPASSV